MGSIRPLLAIVVFVVCALLLLNHGRHRGGAPVAAPLEETPSAPKHMRVSRAAERSEAAFELHSVHRQMVKLLRRADRGHVPPKTLSSLTCTRAKAHPQILDRSQAVGFDCVATYTSGQRQGWCVAYVVFMDVAGIGYEGARMCEGPPDPAIRF
jgi:hypothetical protein